MKKFFFLLLFLGVGFCIQRGISLEEASSMLSWNTIKEEIPWEKAQKILDEPQRELTVFLNKHLAIKNLDKFWNTVPFMFSAEDKPTSDTTTYHSPYIYVFNRSFPHASLAENQTTRVAPASLTKIMTCLVALENITDLDARAPINAAIYREMWQKKASLAGFSENEPTTYRDLLYATMLASGGEAANSLAFHVGGSVSDFVQMMNAKAKSLGLKNTAFKNPEGLDEPGQYTSAQDISKLLDYALENPEFRKLFTTETYTTSATVQHPQGIKLVSTVLGNLTRLEQQQDGFEILGGKSGTTSQAGQCWALLAKKKHSEYIVVLMGAELNNINRPDLRQKQDALKILQKLKF